MQARFTRHRYELPLLGAFFAVAAVELLAIHLLVSLWSRSAAWLLSALTLFALVQIGLLVHGMIKWPTVINESGITVRHGRRGEIFIPLTQVARVEDVAFRPQEKGPHAFRATIFAQPNVAIQLTEPLVRGRRRLERIAMRLDDPTAFHAMLQARLADRGLLLAAAGDDEALEAGPAPGRR